VSEKGKEIELTEWSGQVQGGEQTIFFWLRSVGLLNLEKKYLPKHTFPKDLLFLSNHLTS
jgi:hypothetical protein